MGFFDRFFADRDDTPVIPPAEFHCAGPEYDAEEFSSGKELDDIEGLAVGLYYRDANGVASRRIVVCNTIDPSPPGYINGFCQLRNDDRTFRIDRIEALVDVETGEFIDGRAIGRFFAPYFDRADTELAARNMRLLQRRVGPSVRVLAFLALADGKWHPLEKRIAVEYAMDEASYMVPDAVFEEEEIERWVGNLRPTRAQAEKAAVEISKSPERFPDLADAMMDLIKADGVIDPTEAKAVRGLIDAIRADRASAADS